MGAGCGLRVAPIADEMTEGERSAAFSLLTEWNVRTVDMKEDEYMPQPEDREREPRFMPDGSLDWQWFYRESEIMRAWLEAGLCVDCGDRPQSENRVVCDDAECNANNGIEFLWTCSFCGSKKQMVGGSLSPIHPVRIQYCSNCADRRVPSRDEAIGQGRMF